MPGIDSRGWFVEDDNVTPGSSRCRDDEALFLSSREAQWVPIPQVREVEVSQELLPGLTTRFGCPDCEFSAKCVGKELSRSCAADALPLVRPR